MRIFSHFFNFLRKTTLRKYPEALLLLFLNLLNYHNMWILLRYNDKASLGHLFRYCHLIELFSADRETVFFNVLRKQKAVIEPADFSIALRGYLQIIYYRVGMFTSRTCLFGWYPRISRKIWFDLLTYVVETVIVRFFYDCNLMGDWKMTLNDVKRSCLLDVWDEVTCIILLSHCLGWWSEWC